MARRFSVLAVVPLFLLTTTVMADETEQAATEQKPQTYTEKMQHYMSQLKPVSTYAGVGLFDDMLNANVETVTDLGNFYLRVGKFMEADTGLATNIGWRYPLTNERDESGYFLGVFFGKVMASSFAGEDYDRNGAGFDVSYQWVTESTRKTISVGLGTGFDRKVDSSAKGEPPAPQAFFSFSAALKVF